MGESPTGERNVRSINDSCLMHYRTMPDSARFMKILYSYMGVPYKFGGMSRTSVDCSGLVCLVYREHLGMALPRSAADMIKTGSSVQLEDARLGDLVFFRWGFPGDPDHVGIYVGGGKFVHASTSLGVIESSMDDAYYRSHFIGARRILS